MDKKIIRNALNECRDIEDVLCFENKEYQGAMYDFLVECCLVAGGECVPIRIGINDNWPIKLFDFYIHYENGLTDSRYCFIPHVDKKGKMCLWGLDNILIEVQFEGLLQECVKKAIEIIEDGKYGKNKAEFIREFRAYWRGLPNIKYARLVMPTTENSTVIKWGEVDDDTEGMHIIAALSADIITEWCICRKPLRNAAFFNIDATNEGILPLNPAKPDYISFVNYLLDIVEYNIRTRILDKLRNPYIIFFHIQQPNDYWADVGFRINSNNESIHDILKKGSKSNRSVEPIFVSRIDRNYLMQRVAQPQCPLESLNYLIIGAGSIGGYLADFLGRAGGKKVTVVDGELFFEENIFRHLLGKIFVRKSKAQSICRYISASLPEVNYKPIPMTIEEAHRKKIVVWNDYDVIFAATGNENVNRWLEKNIEESSVKCKVIYLWNEPMDIGCHAAYVNMDYHGRYNDLFRYDDHHMLYNISSFADPNQEFTGRHAGCDGSFMPYGSEVSIQAALLGLDLLKKSVSGFLQENVIISYKGEGNYFKRGGFRVSQRYESQVETVCVNRLDDIRG